MGMLDGLRDAPRSELLRRPASFGQLRELIDGIAPDPDRIVYLARAQLTMGNDPRKWPHPAWALTRRWYASVQAGYPDYGVYGEDDYLADVWACWVESSRPNMLKLLPPKGCPPYGVMADALRGVDTVVDLGCGIGITTAVLTQLAAGKRVVATNVAGCAQYAVAERLGGQYGFTMVPEPKDVGGGRCAVFASEYFEHFQEPDAHLGEVLDSLDPEALIMVNSFTQPSIGHFPEYHTDNGWLKGAATAKAFNSALACRGYLPAQTSLWNHRPAYWTRNPDWVG